jgi:hypothetical protein
MLFLAAAPTVLSQATPVTVVACSYVPAFPVLQLDNFFPRTQRLTITFVNDAQRVATHVRFHVHYGGWTETIEDAGHFAPGVPIVHRFTPQGDGELPGPADCTIEAVAFDEQ